MLKECKKCGVSFSGRRCKPCHAAYVRSWNAKNPEKLKDIRTKAYRKNKDKILVRSSKYAKANPDIKRASQERYREKYPRKRRAHSLISDLLRSGRLVKEPCKICQETKVQAHHDDYLRPLDVTWLCIPHHAAWHRVFIAENP